jgi:lysophospholipase L1-like esterase
LKNHLSQSAILVFIVLASLLLLHYLAFPQIGNFSFKPIDFLADVWEKPLPKAIPKPLIVIVKKANADSAKAQGITAIEDYSPNHKLLKPFYDALSGVSNHPVRIAFYGDSFVEGDILLGDLRDTLQSVFGGRGVGYVPITSTVSGFRQTIKHHYSNFKSYTIVDSPRPAEIIGFGGNTAVANSDSKVTYEAVKYRYLNSFKDISLFYSHANTAELSYKVNNGEEQKSSLEPGDDLRKTTIKTDGAKSIDFDFQQASGAKLYGASFEDSKGIYVDNFSMRGNSGIGLSLINTRLLSEYDSIAPHRLILLQYGLNVANAEHTDYSWYTRSMSRTIEQIKKAFPNSSIVLVGVSDRAEKINGGYVTMRGINELIIAQRQMAKDAGIGFYNLFEAMGGDSSMVRFANANPSLANKDYTHLNFKGGKKVAQAFAKTILYHYKESRN